MGSIPTLVGEICQLRHLYLYSNDLFSTKLLEISNLKNMTSLLLSYNNIKNTIPVEIGLLKELNLMQGN